MEEQEVFVIRPAKISQLNKIFGGIVFLLIGFGGFAAPWLFVATAIGLFLLVKAWYNIVSRQYRLTTERLFIRRGLIAKHVEEVELYRIKDLKLKQRILDRIFRVGAITVFSTDDTTPVIYLPGIANPEPVKEQIRANYRQARQREGIRGAEFIQS